MEKLGPQQSETESKMHSKIINAYNRLASEYEALFENNENVNPANENHLKLLEDYLDKRGLKHNNYFIHDKHEKKPDEKEVDQVIDDFSLNRINELTSLIEAIDNKIKELEDHPYKINQRIVNNQLNIYHKLRSKYIQEYRGLRKGSR